MFAKYCEVTPVTRCQIIQMNLLWKARVVGSHGFLHLQMSKRKLHIASQRSLLFLAIVGPFSMPFSEGFWRFWQT